MADHLANLSGCLDQIAVTIYQANEQGTRRGQRVSRRLGPELHWPHCACLNYGVRMAQMSSFFPLSSCRVKFPLTSIAMTTRPPS